ncbi:MAG: VOC family protein [Rhodobacteraceae bacterium]|nr:VOC family protein [Paracoccaceae bacterium]
MSDHNVPPIDGILETAVYVDDLEAAHDFYGGVLGFKAMTNGPRLRAYDVAPSQVLLVFKRGDTSEDVPTSGGVIPGHHGEGNAHFAFSIAREQCEPWRTYLESKGVAITGEVNWPKGGVSLYFCDPDGNVLELASAPLWPNYM